MNWQPFDKENLIEECAGRFEQNILFKIIKYGQRYGGGKNIVQWVDFGFGSKDEGEIICQPRGESIWYIVEDDGHFTLGKVTHYTFIDPVEDDEE